MERKRKRKGKKREGKEKGKAIKLMNQLNKTTGKNGWLVKLLK